MQLTTGFSAREEHVAFLFTDIGFFLYYFLYHSIQNPDIFN